MEDRRWREEIEHGMSPALRELLAEWKEVGR